MSAVRLHITRKRNYIMNGYRFFKIIRLLIGFALIIPLMFLLLAGEIYSEHSTQKTFQTQYGADWQMQFDKHFGAGSLEQSNKKIMAASIGLPVYSVLVFFFVRMLMKSSNMSGGRSGGGRRRKSRRKNAW